MLAVTGQILTGKKQRRFRPAAAGAAGGGGGRIASRQERTSARGEQRDNAYGRERGRGMTTGWLTNSVKDQKRPNNSDSTIGKWLQNTRLTALVNASSIRRPLSY
jgi:hypothetical protein